MKTQQPQQKFQPEYTPEQFKEYLQKLEEYEKKATGEYEEAS